MATLTDKPRLSADQPGLVSAALPLSLLWRAVGFSAYTVAFLRARPHCGALEMPSLNRKNSDLASIPLPGREEIP